VALRLPQPCAGRCSRRRDRAGGRRYLRVIHAATRLRLATAAVGVLKAAIAGHNRKSNSAAAGVARVDLAKKTYCGAISRAASDRKPRDGSRRLAIAPAPDREPCLIGGLMVEDSPDPTGFSSRVPSDAAIHQILVERIDRRRHGVGMAVGVIDAQGC